MRKDLSARWLIELMLADLRSWMSFQATTHPRNGLDLSGELDEPKRYSLQYIFAYSAIWGLGGNLDR